VTSEGPEKGSTKFTKITKGLLLFFVSQRFALAARWASWIKENDMNRCAWGSTNPLMIEYHDTEWGVPLHDEQKLFEFLVLEGMQAGLSWSTILNKRDSQLATIRPQ
jgi:hypothetical protein